MPRRLSIRERSEQVGRADVDTCKDLVDSKIPHIQRLLHSTEIGKKAGLFAKLQPGRARKRINAT